LWTAIPLTDPMKPTPKSQVELKPLVAFGAHPDDIEFGCGGVIAREHQVGRQIHFVICSHGEAGSYGTPKQRMLEAKNAAKILGATVEFIMLDGDAHLEVSATHAIKLAAILRRVCPGIVLAPSVVENQHPDHYKLGRLVRDAARLARYGGLKELRKASRHAIDQLYYYAVTAEAEPRDISPVLINVSAPEILAAWTAAMAAHQSQVKARNYIELQLTRARLLGARAGLGHAIALFPNDPPVLDSLTRLDRSARRF
jgi:LmbE family N-acetylglucosaminyl deacetylase